jgi:hypothetical protein
MHGDANERRGLRHDAAGAAQTRAATARDKGLAARKPATRRPPSTPAVLTVASLSCTTELPSATRTSRGRFASAATSPRDD